MTDIYNTMLPDDDNTAEQFIARITILLEQAESLTAAVFKVVSTAAPVLLQPNCPVGIALASLGLMLSTLEERGRTWMAAHGVTPMDLATEQRALARTLLERGNLPAAMRDELLAMLAEGLEEGGASEEWAEFVSDGKQN